MRKCRLCTIMLLLVAPACSTVTVRVPVMRPAEINLRGKNEIVIGYIRGRESPRITGRLKQAVADAGRFKLVSREHMDEVMRELRLSASDLADADSQRKLGKLMTGSILIGGGVESFEYNENQGYNQTTCTKTVNKKTVEYPCTKRTRTGKAEVAVAFDTIDIATGENLKPKRLQCTRTRATEATDGTPPSIDGDALLEDCANEIVTKYLRAIAPWQDYVNAPFKKDGDAPALEIGISFAARGEWSDAIAKFQEAIDFLRSKPDVDAETVAKAHWNLGLAYEYTFQFDKASEEVKRAFEMTQDAAMLRELDNIKRLRAEQEKLREQTEGAGA